MKTITNAYVISLRLVIGLMFVYAGIVKTENSLDFATSISSFRLVPPILVGEISIVLPALECILGALLALGLCLRPVLLLMTVVNAAFLTALLLAAIRKLPADCGCFGSATGEYSLALSISRDCLILAGLWCINIATYGSTRTAAVSRRSG